jgi:hypothetical protein
MSNNSKSKDSGKGKEAPALGAYDVTEHLMGVPEVADRLATNVNASAPEKSPGLSAVEVRLTVRALCAIFVQLELMYP